MASRLLLGAFCAFNLLWFRVYLTAAPVPSEDLPAHIAVIERLAAQWWQGRFSFYDPAWFTGWPAFQFYSFFAHLVAAVLSLLLGPFTAEPARLAVHLLAVLGVSLLPLSVFYAAVPFARQLVTNQKQFSRDSWLLALGVCCLSFWFLNHDAQFYGVGAGAPLFVGLFSQVFGWHLLLVYLGALARLVEQNGLREKIIVTTVCALLILTHSLTAVYALFLAFLCWCWFRERRWAVFACHLLAVGCVGFWLVPFLVFAGEYATSDPYPPIGDTFAILFRYPWQLVVDALYRLWQGDNVKLNPTFLVMFVLCLSALIHRRVRTGNLLLSFLVFLLLSMIVFSSEFVAASIPLGIHYYRVKAFFVLMLLPLLTPIPLILAADGKGAASARSGIAGRLMWVIVFLGCFYVTAELSPRERDRVIENAAGDHLRYQEQIVSFLQEQPDVGRVYVEHLNDYGKYPYLSCHYLFSRLYQKAGVETINGLFMESSLAHRMPVVSADILGANTFHGFFVFRGEADLSAADALRQLREFGVTHVVAGSRDFVEALERNALQPPLAIGPYRVVRIADKPLPPVEKVDKTVVGYLDLRGNLPFSLVEFYFYANGRLSSAFEVLELSPSEEIPSAVRLMLLNTDRAKKEIVEEIRNKTRGRRLLVGGFTYRGRKALDHYRKSYPPHRLTEDFRDVKRLLDRKFLKSLTSVAEGSAPEPAGSAGLPEFIWDADNQAFTLRNLVPGELYRINYSYFPYWYSGDGMVYRGSEERIFFIPSKNEARFIYTRSPFVSTWIGWMMSAASVILGLSWVIYERRKPGK